MSTAGDCMQLSREKLADTGITSAGEQFTDTVLLPHLKTAFRDLNSVAVMYGLPSVFRSLYRYLPEWRGILDLSSPEYVSLEPFRVLEGIPLTLHQIDTATVVAGSDDGQITALLQVVVDAVEQSTSLRQGALAMITGATGEPALNGVWPVVGSTTTSPITTILNCDVNPAAGVFTYAKMLHLQSRMYEIFLRDEGERGHVIPGQIVTKREYSWLNSKLTVFPSFKLRAYQIDVFANLTEPATAGTAIPFIGAENFLAARTAALAVDPLAGGSQDASPSLAIRLDEEARGPKRQNDGSGGALADWLGTQRIRLRMPPVGPPVAGR